MTFSDNYLDTYRGATDLFVVFGDFVAECHSSIPVHDPNPGGPDGTLTRPASKSYVFYGIIAANNLFPVTGTGIATGQKKGRNLL